MKSGKVILGVLAGLAAGAALGILFAPHKGEKTRKKISDSAKDLKNKMTKAAKNLGKKAEALKDEAAEKLAEAGNSAKQKANALTHN
jgi:gas vesicle protein